MSERPELLRQAHRAIREHANAIHDLTDSLQEVISTLANLIETWQAFDPEGWAEIEAEGASKT